MHEIEYTQAPRIRRYAVALVISGAAWIGLWQFVGGQIPTTAQLNQVQPHVCVVVGYQGAVCPSSERP